MKINPGLRPRPEVRVYNTVKTIAIVAAVGVMLAGIFTFLEITNQEDCSNGIDDDRDGWVDMADSDCSCTSPPATSSFIVSGSAQYFGKNGCDEVYQLNESEANTIGLIGLKDNIDLTDTVDLTFNLDLGGIDRGGLGMSMVLTTGDLMTSSCDVRNECPMINLAPSLIIEIDTHNDGSDHDIAQDHISIYQNGNSAPPIIGPVALSKHRR